MAQAMTVQVWEDGRPCRVTWPQENGQTRVFGVSPKRLGEWLAKVPQTERGEGEAWLDCLVSPSAMASRRVGAEVQVILATDKRERVVQLIGEGYGGEPMTIILPPLVWLLNFRQRQLYKAGLYVAERRILSVTDSTLVIPWPFGNVYTHGDVCWGSVMPRVVTLQNPWEVENAFFGTAFNGDLWVAQFPYRQAELEGVLEANGNELLDSIRDYGGRTAFNTVVVRRMGQPGRELEEGEDA